MSEGMKKVNSPPGPLGAREITVYQCRCRCGHEWISREPERPARMSEVQIAQLGSSKAVRTGEVKKGRETAWRRVLSALIQ